MTTQVHANEHRPRVAYVTLEDNATRERVAHALGRAGWCVNTLPTGFHLVQAISDILDGHPTGSSPSLIVVDSRARGCTGTTIAAGLHELGIPIPVVVTIDRDEPPPLPHSPLVRVVRRADADAIVHELAVSGLHGGRTQTATGLQPAA